MFTANHDLLYWTGPRRGRLVAYGARLESVLGASPRGFESLSLRQEETAHLRGGLFASYRSWDLKPYCEAEGSQGVKHAEARFEHWSDGIAA